MSKEKFLTYLLTTTLIVPSFSTAPIANAADDHSKHHLHHNSVIRKITMIQQTVMIKVLKSRKKMMRLTHQNTNTKNEAIITQNTKKENKTKRTNKTIMEHKHLYR